MTDQVRKILDCYRSENPGVLTNLVRILNHGRLGGTGRMIILPVDQGFEHGPDRVARACRREYALRHLCPVAHTLFLS